MIIQTGSRTDIPAFYADWFANRLREGYVYVRNPYNMTYVTKYTLHPSVVDLISFCSKNPKPMLKYLDLLRPYGMYWYVTITGYGRDIEPNVPDIPDVIETFKRLSEFAGIDSMGWRYDPIFLDDKYTREYHLEKFAEIASELEGYTNTSVISFIDIYQKVKKNFPEVKALEKEDRLYLGEEMAQIARQHGMVLRPCAEGNELEAFGADCSGCMTPDIYEKAVHNTMSFPKVKNARASCKCFLGNDIGMYNTCLHMCRYCYANYDYKTVMENHASHDPMSPLLVGHIRPEDEIHQIEQKSWIDGQLRFDFLSQR
jgi:DNA repair photolyase